MYVRGYGWKFIVICRLNSSRSHQELDSLWMEMKAKNIEPDNIAKETYRKKLEQFESTVS